MTRPAFVDPDYWHLLGGQTPAPPPPQTDLYAIRNTTTAATKAASDALSFPIGMTTTVSTATASDGSRFNITRFVPLAVQQSQHTAPPQRAVVYAFGGGLIAGSVAVSYSIIANFAEQIATQVFAPDYRLAPEHPYPAALDDAHSVDFNVNPARIITFGQSAGGALTAAAALKARDEGLNPPLVAQVLRYPMLDDRTTMDPQNPRFPFLTWSPSSNTIVWKAYLGKINETKQSLGCAAPAPYTATPTRADALHGLPPTHLGVGGLDLFRDESVAFAARLSSHNVKVQSKVYPGVPHGFDGSPAFSLRFELWSDEAKIIQQY
ncbi:hypothetical protein M406DRAFT_68921 [Cryphonectria parasitica EP155]|uniref:Alpha/beta hydrolase fold-3 domain-containing protein n=1 Tax=Cryphonectria parasitica (strain ATCC 38755 / EP155) TaxID=660469 RepID=A0A9P4Y4P7_CRYP1|nr:uncharacterized protein M406DRAFT_68921 [Cryphonectria parasitica EP155]KAF3766606.1 hypothetical protein M406DRAFT_68921 [Cryphonectria parasitica EP155]